MRGKHTYGGGMEMRDAPRLGIIAFKGPALERRGLGPSGGEYAILVLVCGKILVRTERRYGLDVDY